MSADVRDAEMVKVVDSLATIPEREEFHGYQGVATVSLSPDQLAKIQEPMPAEAYDILPTGEVYVSQVHYRRLLNRVFGPGSWALVPRGKFHMQDNTVCREYALVGPGGRFISEAIGEAEYQPNNDRMSYASACEAVKSNALTRCCKDLGIASECWDRRFCEDWKAANAVSVWRRDSRKRQPQWRRKDAAAFYDEQGPAEGSAGQHGNGDERSAPPRASGSNGASASEKPACPQCHKVEKVIVGKYPDKRTKVQKPWYCLSCKVTYGNSEQQPGAEPVGSDPAYSGPEWNPDDDRDSVVE